MRLQLVSMFILLSLSVSQLWAEPKGEAMAKLFATALQERSRNRVNDWAPGVVDEWAKEVARTVVEVVGEPTEQQLNDIAAGLKTNLPHVSRIDFHHPIAREYARQSLLYVVRNYLAFGPGDPGEAKKLRGQIAAIAGKFKDAMMQRYPGFSQEIAEGTKKAVEIKERGVSNPLSWKSKRPISDEAMERVFEKMEAYIDGLTLKERGKKAVVAIDTALLRTLSCSAMRDSSASQKLPEPPELVEARKTCRKNQSMISAWYSRKSTEAINAQMRKERLKREQARALQAGGMDKDLEYPIPERRKDAEKPPETRKETPVTNKGSEEARDTETSRRPPAIAVEPHIPAEERQIEDEAPIRRQSGSHVKILLAIGGVALVAAAAWLAVRFLRSRAA